MRRVTREEALWFGETGAIVCGIDDRTARQTPPGEAVSIRLRGR